MLNSTEKTISLLQLLSTLFFLLSLLWKIFATVDTAKFKSKKTLLSEVTETNSFASVLYFGIPRLILPCFWWLFSLYSMFLLWDYLYSPFRIFFPVTISLRCISQTIYSYFNHYLHIYYVTFSFTNFEIMVITLLILSWILLSVVNRTVLLLLLLTLNCPCYLISQTLFSFCETI